MPGLSRRTLTPLLPGVALLAVFGWWMLEGGGYDPIVWLPGAVLLLALGATVLLGLRGRLGLLPRAVTVALAAFAAYTVWSYLSIAWADDPGAALAGSHRTLLYLCCFAFAAVLPWTVRAGMLFLTGLTLLAAGVALGAMLDAVSAANPTRFFLEGRYDAPIGYPNAAAALWTIAALPALVLGSRRETPAVLRPVLLAAATLLLGTAVMGQSRGWLIALPIATIAALLLVPGRVRLLVFALPVAVGCALSLPAILDPYQVAADPAALASAFDEAVRAVVLSVVGVLAVTAAMVAGDLRVRLSHGTARAAGRVAAAGAVAMLVLGTGVAVAAVDGQPIDRLQDAWTEFKGEGTREYDDASRFTALQSPRYATWKVAVDAWTEAPLAGLGQDNFAERYLLTRTTLEEPRWPHSLELRLLVHTGIIGALLFVVFLVAATRAGIRETRGDPAARAVAAAALLPLVVWVAHGSVDWLWEYPVLSGPALAALGVVGRLGGDRDPLAAFDPPAAPGRLALAGGVVLGVAAFAAAVALVTAFAAERHLDATSGWRADPEGVMTRLDRAQDLSPLDSRAAVAEGLVAWSAGDRRRARRALLEAAERKPRGWFIQLELGLLSGEVRDLARARGHLRSAVAFNPTDDVVRLALRRAEAGRPLSRADAERAFTERWAQRAGARR